jgi:hypothetical protein
LHPRRRAAIASMSAAKSAKGKPRTDCEGAAAANTAASRDQRTSSPCCVSVREGVQAYRKIREEACRPACLGRRARRDNVATWPRA